MALRYGFFNSINNDRRYDALDMCSIFDGIIEDGVFATIAGVFAVEAGVGMQVTVDSGKAWFNHTWTSNDAKIPLTIDAPDITLNRYDAVVLEVNNEESVRANSIKVIKGDISSSPQKPILINTDLVHQHPLAYILVKSGVSEINNRDIENVIGTSECPFVTGPLETVPIDSLFARWEAEFDYWFENVKTQLSGDVAANLQRQIDDRVKIADKATPEEVSAGTNDEKWITPLAVSILDKEWQLIDKLDNTGAMSGEWTAPDVFGDGNPYDIGVYMIGGGGSGASCASNKQNGSPSSGGGGSGFGKNLVLKSVIPGTKFPYIIGKGGEAASLSNVKYTGQNKGNNGGTTSFNSVQAQGGYGGGPVSSDGANSAIYGGGGGQGAISTNPTPYSASSVPMYGSKVVYGYNAPFYGTTLQVPQESQNQFDRTMVTLCAGGFGYGYNYTADDRSQVIIAMPDGTKGGDGVYKNATSATGESATGYGNGGGGCVVYHPTETNKSATSGAGSDGVIFIYARRHIE